jgi:O-antigen ligase
MILRLLIAASVLAVGADGGTYSVTSRHSLAVVAWWTILVAIAFGVWRVERLGGAARVAVALLAAFALLALASAGWGASAERALLEVGRILLYVGVFLIAALGARPTNVDRWCDGIGAGIVGIALVALASRLFPDLVPTTDVPDFLPGTQSRLMFPVNYWNGLGVLSALGIPFVLRAACDAAGIAGRALAVAALPLLGATIFLTSSRGGTLAALLGAGLFLFATDRRWRAVGAAVVGALATAAAIAALLTRPVLLDGPFESAAAADAGRSAAMLIIVIAAAAGGLYTLASRSLPWPERPRPLFGRALGAATAVAAVLAVAAADPVQRFEDFRRVPELGDAGPGFVTAHLLSSSGGGRWQFWAAAVDQFRAHPLAGGGAGSYEAWWAQHGSFAYFVRDAHSLYLETLGELGILGFSMLLALVALAAFVAVRGVRGVPSDARPAAAALAAALGAYAVAAGIDWMWELTVVSVVAFVAFGLLAGLTSKESDSLRVRLLSRRLGIAAAVAMAGVAVSLEAIPLLTQVQIHESRAAVARGDTGGALTSALAARSMQPWAASPYLQLALVEEEAGAVRRARERINSAITRDANDWRLWLVRARLETKDGNVAAARRSLARARALNPRSPIFSGR